MAKKHWISIKRGLIREPKHRIAMGECFWLFAYMIDIADWDSGKVLDWKDEAASEDMQMPIRTLREQRRKLEELDYISCSQKRYGQEITILNWTNPREYSGEIHNPRKGDSKASPSKDTQGDIEGYTQGYTKGSTQDVTPTSNPKNQISGETAPDFANMSINDAYRLPTLQMYRDATGVFPGAPTWEYIHNVITTGGLTKERITAAFEAWCLGGYNNRNVKGILEWARDGVPTAGVKKQQGEQKPVVIERKRHKL